MKQVKSKYARDISGQGLAGHDLSGVDLTGVIADGADFSGADLSNALLSGGSFEGASFRNANMARSIAVGADFSKADFSKAVVDEASFSRAIFADANLRRISAFSTQYNRATLTSCCMAFGIFRGAAFQDARMDTCDLAGANFSDATLMGVDISKNTISHSTLGVWLVPPERGSFIAYKKLGKNKIAELFVPADALRTSATTRKIRVSRAKVLKIWDARGEQVTHGYSVLYNSFLYRVGDIVEPDSFDDDRWNECSNGIHCFLTREEAEMW